MARPRRSDILREFERKSSPDLQKIAELTRIAIGHRKAYEFALLCGVNASTISRILNPDPNPKKKVSSISDELIVSIAANAETNNAFLFGQLLEAHGVEPKDGRHLDLHELDWLLRDKIEELAYRADREAENIDANEKKTESRVVKNIKEIVANALLEQKLRIQVLDDCEMLDQIPLSIMTSATCDFAIQVFDPKTQRTETMAYLVLEDTAQRAISRLEKLFCALYLNDFSQRPISIHIAFFDPSMYQRTKDFFRGYKIRDNVSLHLFDFRLRRAVEVFSIPSYSH